LSITAASCRASSSRPALSNCTPLSSNACNAFSISSALRNEIERHGNARLLRREWHRAMPHVRWEQQQLSDLRLDGALRRHYDAHFDRRHPELNVTRSISRTAHLVRQCDVERRTDPTGWMDVVHVKALAGQAHGPTARKSKAARVRAA